MRRCSRHRAASVTATTTATRVIRHRVDPCQPTSTTKDRPSTAVASPSAALLWTDGRLLKWIAARLPEVARHRYQVPLRASGSSLRLPSRSAVNSRVVPTEFCMNAPGRRAASAWTAFQPVQWVGTRTSGARSARASQVSSMIGSKSGPFRWKASHHQVETIDSGQSVGVAADVHDAGVARNRSGPLALAGDVHDQGLIVEDQRVGLPGAISVGLVDREALLERASSGRPRRSREPTAQRGTRVGGSR